MLDNLFISPDERALLEKRRASLRRSMLADYFSMVLGAGLLLLHFMSVIENLRYNDLAPFAVIREPPPHWLALLSNALRLLGGQFFVLPGALCLHVGVRSYSEHRRDQALLDEGHLPEDVLPPDQARISWSWLVILILLPFLSLIDSGNSGSSFRSRSAASALLAVVFALIYFMIHAVRKLCWMRSMRARDTDAADDPSR